MISGAAVANLAALAAALPARRAFRAALDDPGRVQAAVLRRILEGAAGSAFAREHRLDPAGGIASFRRAVPPRTYDGHAPWIDRAAAGEPKVLTSAPVVRFQPSSGSSAASKLLPWTDPFSGEVRRAVAAWLADMAVRHPALLGGPAYWSLSPAGPARSATTGGIPVGFEDDAAYLGPVARRLAAWGMAVPGGVRHLADVDAWRRRTLLHLLRARELRLLSVWSPSFLQLLLAPLDRLLGELAGEVARGSPVSATALGPLAGLPPDPARARELERAGPDPRRLWPRLALVSCWTDGPSAEGAAALARRLDGIPVEGKGLIATEAVVSFPFGGERPLAVTSHFLELDMGDGEPRPVDALREGDVGSVLVTTGAGLWRYRLQDRVEVTGRLGRTPCIRFLGKEDQLCDRFGEKLHADHVGGVIARLRGELGIADGLAFLAPDEREGIPCYTLFAAARAAPPGISARLEAELGASFHYAHCVRLGQLAPARVFLVAGDGLAPFYAGCAALGLRLGDVKPSPLRREPGWARALPGRYAE
jgi:hypothetical protein